METPGWQLGLDKTPRFVEDFDLDPERTALIVVDMQYSDAHPDYGIGTYIKEKYPEAAAYFFSRLSELAIPNQAKLLDFFRRSGLRVIYLTIGPALPDHTDYKRPHGLKMPNTYTSAKLLGHVGTFEHGILPELAPCPGELVLNKTSSSAFNSTGFDQTLRNLGISYLVFTGVATHACVENTARDAADRGYLCVLVDDACATHTQDLHDATMHAFAAVSGKVQSTTEVIAHLRGQLGKK